LARNFPEGVSVIRNSSNLGTAGAIEVGFKYALERDFDWMWILDPDGNLTKTALEKILSLYESFPSSQQASTGFIACLPLAEPEGTPLHGRLFTPHGRFPAITTAKQDYYACHTTIWAGSLYRLAAVRKVGLPNPDYFIDRDDLSFNYHLMKAGYTGYIHQRAEIRQHISLFSASKRLTFGPLSFTVYEMPPLRCYYTVRNTLYFTIYDQSDGFLAKMRELWRLRSRPDRGMMSGVAWQSAFFTLNFALRARSHVPQIKACLRGIWHGITGNIAARY